MEITLIIKRQQSEGAAGHKALPSTLLVWQLGLNRTDNGSMTVVPLFGGEIKMLANTRITTVSGNKKSSLQVTSVVQFNTKLIVCLLIINYFCWTYKINIIECGNLR